MLNLSANPLGTPSGRRHTRWSGTTGNAAAARPGFPVGFLFFLPELEIIQRTQIFHVCDSVGALVRRPEVQKRIKEDLRASDNTSGSGCSFPLQLNRVFYS